MYLRKNMECPRFSAADRGNRREVVCGENQTGLSEVSAETEYAEYSVCDHSDADAACRCLCRIFVSKSQQEKQAQIIVQDNQELAEQINVSMSQYLHSMMRLSDTLYYNIIKGHDSGQMKQMFQAMYDGYKDYVESIALFQEDGTLLQVMPALSSAASSDVMQEEWFSSALERSENIHFFRPQIQDCF